MAPATRQVAAEIFSSQPVQAVVVHAQYTEEFIANQCIVAAGELVSMVDGQKLDESCAKVAMGAFTAMVGRVIIGGKASDFRAQAEIACQRAALFHVYDDRAAKQKPEAPKADEPPANQPESETPAAPVGTPVEDLGLPDKIVEFLQAAKLTTAEQVLDADKEGKVLAIDGIGPQAHKKILEAIHTKLASAQ